MDKRKLGALLGLWSTLLATCLLLGIARRSFADGGGKLPDCQRCSCKEIYAMRLMDSNGWAEAFSSGYKSSQGMGVFTAVQNAEVLIYSGACPNLNSQVPDSPTVYGFEYTQPNTVCSNPQFNPDLTVGIEDSPTDINAGTQVDFTGQARLKCILE